MTDVKNFELYFVLQYLKVDTREFRQDSDNFVPLLDLKVCVLLPRENEYVYNLSQISLKELSGEVAPEPILTPKGFAYVKKCLEKGFDEPKLAVPESEDWNEAVETEKKLEPGKVEDWGNTTDPFKLEKVVDEKWDDAEEKW